MTAWCVLIVQIECVVLSSVVDQVLHKQHLYHMSLPLVAFMDSVSCGFSPAFAAPLLNAYCHYSKWLQPACCWPASARRVTTGTASRMFQTPCIASAGKETILGLTLQSSTQSHLQALSPTSSKGTRSVLQANAVR